MQNKQHTNNIKHKTIPDTLVDVLGFYIEHLNPMYQNKTRTNLTKDKVIFGKIDFFVL